MFGRYNLRPSPRLAPIDSVPSGTHKFGSYKMDTLIDSIQDVRAILEYIGHPLILVGETAEHWTHHNISADAAVDVLVCAAKLESITDLLIKTGRWARPTSMTEGIVAIARPGTTSLHQIQRDADVLLQRSKNGVKPGPLVRLWSDDTYHLRVSQKAIVETHAGYGRVSDNAWRTWQSSLGAETEPIDIADQVFVPTLPALMNALVYQRRHLWEAKSLLCSDAHGLIGRLTERYSLDTPEFAAPLLAVVEPSTRKYLRRSFAKSETAPPPGLPPRPREGKGKPAKKETPEGPALPSPPASEREFEMKEVVEVAADAGNPDQMEGIEVEQKRPHGVRKPRTPSYSSASSSSSRPSPANKAAVVASGTTRTPASGDDQETVMVWLHGQRVEVPAPKGVAQPKTKTRKRTTAKTTAARRMRNRQIPQKTLCPPPSSSSSARSSRTQKSAVRRLFLD